MRKFALCLVLLSGCSTPGMIKASSVDDLVTVVCDRHDAYIMNDLTLDPDKRQTALDSSAILRKVVKAALDAPPAAAVPAAAPGK